MAHFCYNVLTLSRTLKARCFGGAIEGTRDYGEPTDQGQHRSLAG